MPEETEELNTLGAVSEEIVTEETMDVEETAEIETFSMEETVVEETLAEESAEAETIVEVPSQSSSQQAETEVVAETAESVAPNTVPVSVTVNRGEGSDTVSRRLQEAGLVADAYEYDRYLMANGYDKRIGSGEHVIPAGATWEDIAKILCNMK